MPGQASLFITATIITTTYIWTTPIATPPILITLVTTRIKINKTTDLGHGALVVRSS